MKEYENPWTNAREKSKEFEVFFLIEHVGVASVSKRVCVGNHSNENEFRSLPTFSCKTYFCKKGFAQGIVLKQRDRVTRKWLVRKNTLSVVWTSSLKK